MILCTRACDSIVKSSLSKQERNSVAVKRLVEICELMKLDPATSEQSVEAFIVADVDVKAPKLGQMFEESLSHKHEDARVIFINKDKKLSKFAADYPGIDIVLTTPKSQQVSEAIYSLSAKLSEKPKVQSNGDKADELKPKDVRLSFDDIAANQNNEELNLLFDDDSEEEPLKEPEELPVQEVKEEKVEDLENAPKLVKRMQNANEVSDILNLFKESSAETILRDVAKDNARYGVLEDKIHALKDEIESVMLDTSMSDSQKLQKVRSIAYDKRYYNLQSNTIIEKYVTDIIDCLIKKVDTVLNEKIEEINRSLSKAAQYGEGQANFGRLAGINEERANIIMELHTLDAEIKELAVKAADILTEISSSMSTNMAEISGSDIVDVNIRISGSMVVDTESFETVLRVISLSKESTEFFQKCVKAVKGVIEKHNALVRVDKELIAVQIEYIKYMREHNIENTVIANTLLKKSLRVFTGPEGSGRSIIPYLLSEQKSRTSANVLIVDLTGTCKWDRYGIRSISLDDYKVNRYQNQLTVVKGTCTTPEDAQVLSAILTRAADFYRVINLVLNMEQTQVFDILCSDIRCINFLTDTKYERMMAVKEFMPKITYNNVAKRIIVNDCSIPASEVINFFGIENNMEIQVLTIDHVRQLELASFKKLNPKDIDVVVAALKEVGKYA